jgi:DNA-binding transcriptional regulator YiaG
MIDNLARMWDTDIRALRGALGLSRAELARFLGVSEPTVIRWESNKPVSEPRGLPAVLLGALSDAARAADGEHIRRLVRRCDLNHRAALKALLNIVN